MKKLLALVLALVMTLGLATVAANAAYPDAADVELEEAVDVMSAVGVFQGDENGNFKPQANLDRAAAAKLIAYLDLGEKAAEALPAAQIFKDVPASHWAAKYIAYCYNAGYIAGAGDGNFYPSNSLTGYAFGKMILCVLGYDAAIEGFTGNTWAINVAKLMDSNNITKGIDAAASATLTREQAAQYCLNALKADMVEYETKGTSIEINGAKIATGASKAAAKTTKSTDAKWTAIGNETGAEKTVQLGEKLYDGKLEYAATTTADDLGRQVNKWEYKNKEVASHTSEPVVTYTSKPTAANLAKDLKGYTVNGDKIVDKDTVLAAATKAYGAVTFTNGNKIVDDLRAACDNGKLVEVYADDDKAITNVVVVAYTFAKITDVTTNSKGDVTYKIGSLTKKDFADEDTDDEVKFVGFTPAKNDYVTYVVGTSCTYVYPTTNFTGKMTKYNTTDKNMTVDGTTYKTSTAAVDGSGLGADMKAANAFTGTSESKFYVDQYGFVVAVDGIDDTQYCAVDAASWVAGTGVAGKDYAEARLVFTDGTTKIVTVKKVDSKTVVADSATPTASEVKFGSAITVGNIYKYSISDGKYNLTTDTSDAGGTNTFKKGTPALGADNSTIYVVKTKDGSDDKWTAYTGYKNMPTTSTAVAYDLAKNTSGDVKFVYVNATTATVGDTTSDVALFFKTSYTIDKSDADKPLYIYSGLINDTKQDIISESELTSISADTLYKATIDSDGHVTATAAATASKFFAVTAITGSTPAKNGVLHFASAAVNNNVTTTELAYDGSETVYFVNVDDDTIETGSIESVKEGATIYVKTVEDADNTKGHTLKTAYVITNND